MDLSGQLGLEYSWHTLRGSGCNVPKTCGIAGDQPQATGIHPFRDEEVLGRQNIFTRFL